MSGWNVPPGVSLSDPGGPEDPRGIENEAAEEALWAALYRVTAAGFSVEEIERVWRDAAAEQVYDEAEEIEAERRFYAEEG